MLEIVDEVPEMEVLCFDSFVVGVIGSHLLIQRRALLKEQLSDCEWQNKFGIGLNSFLLGELDCRDTPVIAIEGEV